MLPIHNDVHLIQICANNWVPHKSSIERVAGAAPSVKVYVITFLVSIDLCFFEGHKNQKNGFLMGLIHYFLSNNLKKREK